MPGGSQQRVLDGVTDGCELPCGFWELNPSLLEEQPVSFAAELSPRSLIFFFNVGVLF